MKSMQVCEGTKAAQVCVGFTGAADLISHHVPSCQIVP